MLKNLVYGCSRLTGSFSRGESIAILDCCFSGGLTNFDVAPSYGMGTAEKVLGLYIRQNSIKRSDFSIIGKVGSPRPALAHPKIFARFIKRKLIQHTSDERAWRKPVDGPNQKYSGMNFQVDSMNRSIDRSLNELGIDALDCLLLHEIGWSDVNDQVIYWLQEQLGSRRALCAGYSMGAQFSEKFDVTMPRDWVAQTAPRSEWFFPSSHDFIDRKINIHSIYKSFSVFLRESGMAQFIFDGIQHRCGRAIDKEIIFTFLSLMLMHKKFPEANLIFSTNSTDRLNSLLKAVHWVDQCTERMPELIDIYKKTLNNKIGKLEVKRD